MPRNRYLPSEVEAQVRQRANHLCEYCHTSEKWQYVKFTIDHVIPIVKGGKNDANNLALACFHCNRQKSNKTNSVDPETHEEAALFNPRQENWRTHFIWSKDKLYIIGLTPIGRTTAHTLKFNRNRIIDIRASDLEIGRHPPPDDPIQY